MPKRKVASNEPLPLFLAHGPPPSRTTRQFPRYEDIPESEERRLAVIRLHAQGWSISTIARYLDVSRPTIYATLKRWVDEGVRGLPDKSRANTGKLGVDLPTRNLIRKKQEENPLLGEYRINAALKQLGISVPPRTCGRIMAENRRLYGVNPPQQDRHKPKPHPFKATYREETPLAQYTVQYQPDKKNFKAVPTARRFETPYRSPQGWLWELDDTTWKLAKRLPDYAPRKRRRKPTHIQPTLLR